MRRTAGFFFLGIGLGLLFMGTVLQGESLALNTGEIIDPVVCRQDREQSYALYLPTGYSDEKEWPVMYVFDPAARGKTALSHFVQGGESFGYVLIGSNNVRNGPLAPVIKAAQAVWRDSHDRFSLDDDRVYAAGFSGGSRVASLFSGIVLMPVEGIIGCGAGLGSGLQAESIRPTVYHGIIGLQDFNYQEMLRLDREFDESGVLHRVWVFDGGHAWPPPDVVTEAMGWLELAAMKRGSRSKDGAFIAGRFSAWVSEARELEEQKRFFEAGREWQAILEVFQDLYDTEEIENEWEALEESSEYKKALDQERKRTAEEFEMFRVIDSVLKRMDRGEITGLGHIASELDLKRLKRQSVKEAAANDRALARRLLSTIGVESRGLGGKAARDKDHRKSILFFTLSAEAYENNDPQQRYDLYNLACLYALMGEKRQALQNLRKAVERGFDNRDVLEEDPDLDILRDSPEFDEILSMIKETS